MNSLTIQIDTFCSTKCVFCQLGNNNKVHKEISYSKEEFLAFADIHNTKIVTITGGDTFENKEVFYRAFDYAISVNSIEVIIIPFELIKVKRDRDVIEHIIKNKGNAVISFGVSINPYINNTKYINTILEMGINFSSHIVVGKHDMCKKGQEALKNTIITLNDYGITTLYKLDFNTVNFLPNKENIDFFNKIRQDYREIIGNWQFDSVQTYTRFGLKFGCKAITGTGLGIATSGLVTDCVGISPEKGIGSKNYNVSDYLDYDNIIHSKKETDKQNENEYCNICSIKDVCSRCPKTINKVVGFNGNSLLCQINKQLHEEAIDILKKENK